MQIENSMVGIHLDLGSERKQLAAVEAMQMKLNQYSQRTGVCDILKDAAIGLPPGQHPIEVTKSLVQCAPAG
jgi:hypothetical protein